MTRSLHEARPSRAAVILSALVALLLAGCGDGGEESSGAESAPPSFRSEFMALAREIRAGSNEFLGGVAMRDLRAALRHPRLTPQQRLELEVKMILELLKIGDLDRALSHADGAIRYVGTLPVTVFPANLYKLRALVHMRRAERENCISRHNRECCIFPLAGGAVHTVREPAEAARRDYLKYLELKPEDLAARWLLNVAAMALGEHPQGVPPRFVIPSSAFASAHDPGRFVDVGGDCGVDAFDLCGGCIVDDLDGDGLLDIAASTYDPEGPMKMYRNRGDGRFDDASSSSRLDDQLGGLNCVGADYDGDGDTDILVLRGAWMLDAGRIRNSLLRNDGRGRFVDVTREAGLAEPARPTQTAAWGDFDNDGDLDVYIGNESRMEMRPKGGDHPNQLFLNQGDGTFVDGAAAAGVTNDRYCKGVAAGDYDNDGDLDLYVSNQGPNRLYRNNGDGTFTDVARDLRVRMPSRSFATWFFDFDNDGWLDIFVAGYKAPLQDVAADHLGLEHRATRPRLFRNDGKGGFEDVGRERGLDHAWLPMGASFGDLDNDGWLDIYLATGDPSFESLMPNVLLRNAQGHLVDVTTAAGVGHLQKGHGVTFADIDGDGDQDIYHQLGGFYPDDRFRNALFLNPGHGNRWLAVELQGRRSVRSGHGVRLHVEVEDASGLVRHIHRAVGSVSSFGGSPSRQEIGLGKARRIRRLVVDWPRSQPQSFTDVPLDRVVRVREGDASLVAREARRIPMGPPR